MSLESATEPLHVACPFCGFQNFAISAYCGRCERPLRAPVIRAKPAESTTKTATAVAVPVRPRRNTTAPVPASARTSETNPTLLRPPLVAVPPPLPPPLDKRQPAPLPINLPKKALPKEQRRKRHDTVKVTTPLTLQGELRVTVVLPRARRLILAQLIDLALLTCVGLMVAWADASWIVGGAVAPQGNVLDTTAAWLHSYPGPAWHGLFAAMVFGVIYTTAFARGSGRTLGRALTNTVLIHCGGQDIGWLRAGLRALLAVLSLLPFGAGFFWVVVDRERRSLHDRLLKTVVVHRRKVQPL